MVHILKYIEYNNDYIIAMSQLSLLSVSLPLIRFECLVEGQDPFGVVEGIKKIL